MSLCFVNFKFRQCSHHFHIGLYNANSILTLYGIYHTNGSFPVSSEEWFGSVGNK